MITIKNLDCFEYLKTIESKSIDCVIIDPPYGVLKGHKIETNINIELLISEVYRVLKDNSFFAFFGQMPTIVNWHLEALKLFNWQQDIVWVKRCATSIYLPITRQKELIYIYKKGNIKLNITKEKYEDIKMPLYLDGLLNIESLKCYISDLSSRFKNGNNRIDNIKIINKNNNNKNDKIYEKYSNIRTSRSPELTNITDVWSFMPENRLSFGKNGNNIKHPTVKPIKLLERLIKLLTKENDIILDCFLGSGTTAIASLNTNRIFKGCELDLDYYNICLDRVQSVKNLNKIDFQNN